MRDWSLNHVIMTGHVPANRVYLLDIRTVFKTQKHFLAQFKVKLRSLCSWNLELSVE